MAAPISYTAPATLARFMRSDAFMRVAVGPVGSGKSSACVMEIIRRAREQAPGPDKVRRSRWVVIRNTYRELKDTTRRTFEQWVPAQLGRWREADFAWEATIPLADGTKMAVEVLFRSLNRPEDKKKLLSLELTGAYCNELKEIPKPVIDVLETRVGRYPSAAQGGCTWSGIWCDTNPWHAGHWGAKLFKPAKNTDEGDRRIEVFNEKTGYTFRYELFRQPGGRDANAENAEHLPRGYYERLCHGKDSEWVRQFIDGCDGASDQGAIFGQAIDALEQRGGVLDFDHPSDGVFTSWDLGFTDSTAIWFWRINSAGAIDVIDHYEAHGQPLSHYFDVLAAKGYSYVKHWLPHDARSRTLASGTSILDQFLTRYTSGSVAIGPGLSLLDGIQAGRWLLEQPVRFHTRCQEGLEALRSYHYVWDEDTKTFGRQPEHDWASHTADAWRYTAIVARQTELIQRKPAPMPDPIIPPIDRSFTLEQLWELKQAPARRRI